MLFILLKAGVLNKHLYFSFRKKVRDFGEVKVSPKNYNGMSLTVNSADIGIGHPLILSGEYEKGETSAIKKILRKGDTFVDIGANIGYFSVLAGSIVGETGKVFAFEPDAYNYHLLKRNISNNSLKNIKAYKMAVGLRGGYIKLTIDYDNLGNHNQVHSNNSEYSRVKVIKLDDYMQELDNKISLVKIDIQGMEEDVLLGMKKILLKIKPQIIIELCPELVEASGKNPRRIPQILEECGYRVVVSTINGKKQKINGLDNIVNFAREKGYVNLICS